MRKTYTSRIRVTKNGKMIRRKMGVGHFKSKKSSSFKQAQRKTQTLAYSKSALEKRVKQ